VIIITAAGHPQSVMTSRASRHPSYRGLIWGMGLSRPVRLMRRSLANLGGFEEETLAKTKTVILLTEEKGGRHGRHQQGHT
jgi:hypothetical protein